MDLCKVWCVIYLFGYLQSVCSFSISSFSLGTLCNFQEKLANGCFKSVKNGRGHIGCIVTCGSTEDCTGVVTLASSKACYHEIVCSFTTTCSSPGPSLRYYHKTSPAAHTSRNSSFQASTTYSTTTSSISTTPLAADKQTTPTATTTTTTATTTTPTATTTTPTATTTTPTATTTTPTATTTTQPSTEQTSTSQPPCQNSGTPLTSLKCNCSETGGWAGAYCERRPHNCSELLKFGYSNGTQLFQIDIYRNNSQLIETPCNIGSTKNEVGFLKNTGQYSFNKTWSEYVEGFYLSANNYWLGLDNIVAYSSLGLSKVGVSVSFSSTTVRGTISQEYSGCRFLGNASNYSYTVGYGGSSSRSVMGSGGLQGFDLGDVLVAYQNTPFSTPDKDQDLESGKNCAHLSATGWWFRTCTPEAPVNPLGNLFSSNDDERLILPKYNTTLQGPTEAFKYIYMFLLT